MTAPTFDIPARTEAGAGLTVPLAKALHHLMLVHEASVREWPMTVEAAAAELTEAGTHLTDLTLDPMLLTEDIITEIRAWTTTVVAHAAGLTASSIANPEEPFSADQRANLQEIIRTTWRLLALVDREITGLETTADPGRRP